MQHYDLLVIGGGAGISVVEAAMQNGLKCALVEKAKLGGTCLTKGCIPSKVLVHPADLLREAQHGSIIGFYGDSLRLDWQQISKRVWQKIDVSKRLEMNLQKAEMLELYKGTARFVGRQIVEIEDVASGEVHQASADKIVIAAGARTAVPPIKGLGEAGYLTAESFFGEKYPDKPYKDLVIIGGGAIGLEFAHIFSAFGTKVTLIEMQDRIAFQEEPEISDKLQQQFEQLGIRVLTSTKASSAELVDGRKSVVAETSDGGQIIIQCDEIMLASGVRSNSDMLHLEHTEIEADARGWITTNEYLETSQENVWAIGDINGKFQFRHKANYEVEVLVHNLFSGKQRRKASYTTVPWAIFTHPQIAHVGLTEKQALEAGHKVLVGRNPYSATANGYALGYEPGDSDDGFVKLITDASYKILGVHIIGPQAAILIQPYVYLMNAGASCSRLETEMPNGQLVDGQLFDNVTRLRPGLCLDAGSTAAIDQAMIIHPALSEVAGWVTGELEEAEGGN